MQLGLRDFLAGIAVAVIWGMGVVFAKAAIGHFPPIFLMCLRFTLTALLLVWFVKRPNRTLMGKLFLISLISAAVQYSLTFNGLRGVEASTGVLVIQLEVAFLTGLGALFLGEKTSLRKWLGIAFAFAGVGLIAGEPRLAGSWVSILMLMGGAFTWAVGQIMVRRVVGLDAWSMIAWVAVFAAPQLLVFSLVFESGHLAYLKSANWVVWGTVVYLGVVMTALGYGLWYGLLVRHPASRVAPFLLLLPVTSVLGGILLLGEEPTPQVVAGGLVVIAGLAFILLERPAVPAPVSAPLE